MVASELAIGGVDGIRGMASCWCWRTHFLGCRVASTASIWFFVGSRGFLDHYRFCSMERARQQVECRFARSTRVAARGIAHRLVLAVLGVGAAFMAFVPLVGSLPGFGRLSLEGVAVCRASTRQRLYGMREAMLAAHRRSRRCGRSPRRSSFTLYGRLFVLLSRGWRRWTRGCPHGGNDRVVSAWRAQASR